jgi:hypothetical protein
MFNPTAVVIDAFVNELRKGYVSTCTTLEPDYPGIIDYVGHMALELIANSDAPYHDLGHTICVTLVGQEVLRGKHLREGEISPRDWLHFIISLLCHDIGYVRGICIADRHGHFATGNGKETVELPEGATDASLTPYHIDRGFWPTSTKVRRSTLSLETHLHGQIGKRAAFSALRRVDDFKRTIKLPSLEDRFVVSFPERSLD